MSLKSGLLAETTWAIDALNILLYDDITVAYFHLKHFPGLLTCLIEHFLKCLKLIFNKENGDEFGDIFVNDHLYNEFNESDDESSDDNDELELKKTNKYIYKTHSHEETNGYDESNHEAKLSQINDRKASKKLIKEEPTLPTTLSQFQIMKVNFNDRDTKKRFLHYYKTAKINDAKVNEQWLAFNTKILQKQVNETSERKIKQTDREKHQQFEHNDHLITNFNSGDDVDYLKKLFYGKDFYDQLTETNKKVNTSEHQAPTTAVITEQTNTPTKRKLNDDFISQHRTQKSPHKSQYNDQPITDEDTIFKMVSTQNSELVKRCVSLSTIFRNLSFIPGNEIELCKNKTFLNILSRVLILKHRHKVVLTTDSTIDQDSGIKYKKLPYYPKKTYLSIK